MEKIIYIGYYNSLKNSQKRNIFLPAVNKMNYIIEILDEKTQVNVLSVSESVVKEDYPLTKEKLFNNSELILLPSRKNGNIFQRILRKILIKYSLIKYILKNTNKNTKVIVYHSLGYLNTISFLKKIKKFEFILEIEEIYSDVTQNKKIRKKEIDFFKKADKYIFITQLLNEKVNLKKKPYVITHGTYRVESQKSNKFRNEDGKVHVVYAGNINPIKGGANIAINVAEYLTENYCIHILGIGSKEEIENIKKIISEVSLKTKCTIKYEGVKVGVSYIEFLQGCDIGLSTQNLDTDFNHTSFPSKILSYMSNGLKVVSVDIPAVRSSNIGEYVYYYRHQSSKEIARVIQEINIFDGYDSREIVSKLNKKFKKELFEMLYDL